MVSSQKTYSRIRSSAVTRPSMTPAKAVSSPAGRVCGGSLAKYQRQYTRTSAPIPVTISPSTHCSRPRWKERATSRPGIHS